jgi:hypothetical protein
MTRQRLCVVHLVRRGNGLQTLERFVSAYRRNDPGVEHDLLILFKGFEEASELAQCRAALAAARYLELAVPEGGYDIGSYERAFRRFADEYAYFCFLNSFSEPLREGWLAHLLRHAVRADVGLVGASGSWQSVAGSYARHAYVARLRSGRDIHPLARLPLKAAFALVHRSRAPSFADFPNPHLRTNGFLAPSAVLAALNFGTIRNKMQAYRFESGRDGLTCQVLKLGKKAILAGAEGAGYDVPDWYRANVFWRSAQENLLIADNQTRLYANADLVGQAVLSYYAWGDKASPDASALRQPMVVHAVSR